jgi:ribosomal protein S18 acetylase RimI-like enzyme
MTERRRSSETLTRRLERLAGRLAGLFGVHYYTMLYSEKSLVGEIEHIEAPDALEVRPASADDLEAIFARQTEEEERLGRRIHESGGQCLIAWWQDEMAGYSWLHRDRVLLLGDPLRRLPPEGGYTFNSWVWPEFRGRKVFQVLTEHVYRTLKAEGLAFCCNLVDRNNGGSIGARRKFNVAVRPAPILKLPGLDPFPLERRLPWNLSRPGTSDPSRSVPGPR